MVDEDGSFFLDTSTQLSRTWEDEKIRLYLNRELSQKSCYSSEYVKNEYKLRIINDAILVYNITVDSITLDEAKSRLDTLMKNQGRRSDELPYKVFRRLFREYNSKGPFLRKLEKIIETTWSNYFFGNIKKQLFKLVKCNSAQDNPYKKGNNYIGITSKCSSGCEIDVFLKSQKSALTLLSQINNGKLDKINDPKGTLQKIKNFSHAILHGLSSYGKPCREMSDAIIIIEAKVSNPIIIIYSMDSDFKPLCELIDISSRVHTKQEILNAK